MRRGAAPALRVGAKLRCEVFRALPGATAARSVTPAPRDRCGGRACVPCSGQAAARLACGSWARTGLHAEPAGQPVGPARAGLRREASTQGSPAAQHPSRARLRPRWRPPGAGSSNNPPMLPGPLLVCRAAARCMASRHDARATARCCPGDAEVGCSAATTALGRLRHRGGCCRSSGPQLELGAGDRHQDQQALLHSALLPCRCCSVCALPAASAALCAFARCRVCLLCISTRCLCSSHVAQRPAGHPSICSLPLPPPPPSVHCFLLAPLACTHSSVAALAAGACCSTCSGQEKRFGRCVQPGC